MTDLPPAAQEVLDAFLNGYACKPSCNVAFEADRNGIAAALRAAADQVFTKQRLQKLASKGGEPYVLMTWAEDQFQAIAAELEAQ